SLACALEGSGLSVALVESSAPRTGTAAPSFDERNLALARASTNALQSLGVARHLACAPAAIRHIHVSSQGDFGAVRLDAARYRLPAFGGVVPARELGAALEARMAELGSLHQLRPARVLEARLDAGPAPGAMLLRVETGEGERSLRARLLVAA